MFVIVGLGNPGLRYRNTRHNAGFMAIDALAEKNKLRFTKKRFQGMTAEGVIGGEKVLLLKPYTFMNVSGDAVYDAVNFFKLPTSNVIIIYDDTDLDIGRIRVRPSGSAGTHNGMRSIIGRLRTYDFPRVRIGIGKHPAYIELRDYVLQKLVKDDRKAMEQGVARAALAVEEIIKNGADSAMAKFNGAEK